MQKPKLLIITGPQGSGNHLFSKVFSKHPDVYGWRMKSYWEGHHEEPFNEYWQDVEKLENFDWNQSRFYFTSISCPYFKNKKPQIPQYRKFITTVSKHCQVKIVIIGRDKNILNLQQTRVRKKPTTHIALDYFQELYAYNPVFLSQELYQLYGNNYLQSISRLLDFPIAVQEISEDANAKYITNINNHWLDKEVEKAVASS